MSEMEELSIEQSLEKWPYLKNYEDENLFVTIKDFEKIKDGGLINVDEDCGVYIEFIKNILDNNIYFEYASKLFRGDIDYFSVIYIINGDFGEKISYTKPIIIEAIEQLVNDGMITLTEKEKERYEYLKSFISFDLFKEKVKDDKFDIEMDGNSYSIPANEIISFMELSDEEYESVCKQGTYNGIPIEHFAYATIEYINANKLTKTRLLSKSFKKRYKSLKEYKDIDCQAVNQYLTTTDTLYEKVKMNPELEAAILDGMPEDATVLEKAIYIYLKMCVLLTYDEEYFAVGQMGPATQKHKDINYISTIDLENNEAVCFEFNAMYSKLLNDLGIHFESTYKDFIGEVYGAPHAHLDFRIGKYLVSADPITGVLTEIDILNAKINQPIKGLKVNNANLRTQIEFDNMLNKMYELVRKQTGQIERPADLEGVLKEYALTTDNLFKISFDERLSIMIDKANSSRMKGTDVYGYLVQLRGALFTGRQKYENFRLSVLGNNRPSDKSKEAMCLAVFAVNNNSFQKDIESTKYYLYETNQDYLVDIPLEELQHRFNIGAYEYIFDDDPKIPGIVNGGIKVVKGY
ncbi:MAG: hypothetical protein IKP98_03160 [Bacilli bacterium]|nr:hypothetical protein [Bacilli bacterium]